MHHQPKIQPHWTVPDWLPAAEARDKLSAEMEAFILASIHSFGTAEAMAMAFRVSPGLGKTSTLLRLLATHGRDLLALGHVMIYMPTLVLAERAAEDLLDLNGSLPVNVIRGRQAIDPEGSRRATMCSEIELVEKVSPLVWSTTRSLCRAEKDGEVVEAPCARNCSYMAQMDAKGPRILIMSHQYLTAYPPMDRNVGVALRIIDEKFWQALTKTSVIFVDDFLRPPHPFFPKPLRNHLKSTKMTVLDALQQGLPLRESLSDAGITPQILKQLSQAEEDIHKELIIRPWDDRISVKFKIDTFTANSLFASRKRRCLFDILAKTISDGCNRITLCELATSDGLRQIIQLHQLSELPRDAPLMLLDADADEDITQAIAPGASFLRIDAKPTAEVVQVSDRVVSNSWLMNGAQAQQHRKDIATIVKREVACATGKGVLLVATTAVLTLLHADAGQPVTADPEVLLRSPLYGATPRWFGPSTQGVNDFETFATVIIVGRLQPDIKDLEKSARCLFGNSSDAFLPSPEFGLEEGCSQRLLSDGSLSAAKSREHPDKRVAAVLRQHRENGSAQAIARLRLIDPKTPKRVVLIGSLPLPDLPITKLTTFDGLVAGLEGEPDVEGYLRLQKALRATMNGHVQGTRLSYDGLAKDLPEDFETDDAAKEFRRGRSTKDLQALVSRICAANGWPVTHVKLIRGTGGRATPAVVLAPSSSAITVASMLWHDLHPKLEPFP